MINPSGTNNVIDYANTIAAPSVFNLPNPSSEKKKKNQEMIRMKKIRWDPVIDIKNKDMSS